MAQVLRLRGEILTLTLDHYHVFCFENLSELVRDMTLAADQVRLFHPFESCQSKLLDQFLSVPISDDSIILGLLHILLLNLKFNNSTLFLDKVLARSYPASSLGCGFFRESLQVTIKKLKAFYQLLKFLN